MYSYVTTSQNRYGTFSSPDKVLLYPFPVNWTTTLSPQPGNYYLISVTTVQLCFLLSVIQYVFFPMDVVLCVDFYLGKEGGGVDGQWGRLPTRLKSWSKWWLGLPEREEQREWIYCIQILSLWSRYCLHFTAEVSEAQQDELIKLIFHS